MTQFSIITLFTTALYLVAGTLLWRRLQQTETISMYTSVRLQAGALVLLGLIAHGILLNKTLLISGNLNLSITTAGSLISWVAVFVVLTASVFRPFENLGIAILPSAALVLMVAWLLPGQPVMSRPASSAQTAHIVISLLSYSLLFLAALQSILLLLQERQLRRHRPAGFTRALPPMETMENLMFTMLGSGFLLLTLTLISGVLFSEFLFGQPLRFTHHIVFSVASWVVFAVLIIGHWRFGWRGRTAIRWTLSGFVLLILGYFGSKFVLEILMRP